ncbi:hypothetical protein D6783_02960 [Candidatus Woesearchaeota archaeon]|nr:MAG: hypothetical protein D6783_02960 [Candidatus Woesearchaeota archaeon]
MVLSSANRERVAGAASNDGREGADTSKQGETASRRDGAPLQEASAFADQNKAASSALARQVWSLAIFLSGVVVVLVSFLFWLIYLLVLLGVALPLPILAFALLVAIGNLALRFFAWELHAHSVRLNAGLARLLLEEKFLGNFNWHAAIAVLDGVFFLFVLSMPASSTSMRAGAAVAAILRIFFVLETYKKDHAVHVSLRNAPRPLLEADGEMERSVLRERERVREVPASSDVSALELEARKALKKIQEDLRKQKEALEKEERGVDKIEEVPFIPARLSSSKHTRKKQSSSKKQGSATKSTKRARAKKQKGVRVSKRQGAAKAREPLSKKRRSVVKQAAPKRSKGRAAKKKAGRKSKKKTAK